MEYEGGVDKNIFYLDVPEEELKDTWSLVEAYKMFWTICRSIFPAI